MAASAPRSRARRTASISTSSAPGSASASRPCGIALKFYSCVGSNHTTLDAIRDIRKRRPFALDELDRIVVHGSQVTVDHVGWPYKPEGLTSAQLNLPYCVATLLLEGDCFVDQFTEAAVADPARIALVEQGRGAWKTRRSRRAARNSGTWCASTCTCATARCTARRAKRRAAASTRSRTRDDIVGEIPQAHPRRHAEEPAGCAGGGDAPRRGPGGRKRAHPAPLNSHCLTHLKDLLASNPLSFAPILGESTAVRSR